MHANIQVVFLRRDISKDRKGKAMVASVSNKIGYRKLF